MKQMTQAAVERAMKLQDVMLRAMAKRITCSGGRDEWGSVAGRCSVGSLNTKPTKDCLISCGAYPIDRGQSIGFRFLAERRMPRSSIWCLFGVY